jgi:hypothetical protein
VYNRAALTTQCLDALLNSSAETALTEIVVVDDGSAQQRQGRTRGAGGRADRLA